MTTHVGLIFIGDEFYDQSGTMMSPIYSTDGYRYDWGKIKQHLAAGGTVSIRPATEAELERYKVKVAELILKQRSARA